MNEQNTPTPDNGSIDKPYFLHYRAVRDASPVELGKDPTKELYIDSRGGATIAFALPPEGSNIGILYTTSAVHPRDNYSKRLGRIKTAGRFRSEARVQVTEYTEKKEFIKAMDEYFEKFGLARHFKKGKSKTIVLDGDAVQDEAAA